MKTMKNPQTQEWNTEEAARLAREAYRYVARTYPLDADLEPLGVADARVPDGQARGAESEGSMTHKQLRDL